MKTNIFIPEKINVGFQNRSDTYTKKLAYVIYFDEKGKLRKEASWNSWRDKSIDNEIFENIPTSGFVLNKKVGDYSSGWDHRKSYVRIYDPRDFEFEISVENLLYILENANSIKGKGLEGEFIYGWDGKDLVLIPTESPDYIEIKNFNEIVHSNKSIKVKDLKIGATYLTKSNEEWVYMGRFDYHTTDSEWNDRERKYERFDVNKGKYHYFAREATYSWNNEKYLQTIITKSLGKRFIDVVSEECVENYAELMDKLEHNTNYSPIDDSKDEYLPYTFEEFEKKFEKAWWDVSFYTETYESKKIHLVKREKPSEGIYEDVEEEYEDTSYWRTVTRTRYTRIPYSSIREVYDKYKPHYLNKYLANGKLYREGK